MAARCCLVSRLFQNCGKLASAPTTKQRVAPHGTRCGQIFQLLLNSSNSNDECHHHGSTALLRRSFSSTTTTKSTDTTKKQTIIGKWDNSQKFWMSNTEYTGVVVGKDATNSEYIISDGVIGPGGFVPDHYHKGEDQTFHVISGQLQAKIGGNNNDEPMIVEMGPGDTIHCPRGVSHYIKNIGEEEAKLLSYVFPGDWAEEFMAETSRQNNSGKIDLDLIEEKFGVVYI